MAEVLDYLIFVGTYTTDKSEGIYVFRLEDASGKLEQINLAPNVENPSYLEIHPSGKYAEKNKGCEKMLEKYKGCEKNRLPPKNAPTRYPAEKMTNP